MSAPGPGDPTPRSVLLLADAPEAQANTVRDHVGAFSRWSRHEFLVFNPSSGRDSRLLDLEAFDAVVVHYSLSVISEYHLPPAIREKLRRYSGLKVQFIQDGYRRIEEYCAHIRDLGIEILFTCWPSDEAARVWTPERLPGVQVLHSLTGYVPDELAALPPRVVADRPFHVGYRARPVPFWLGRLGQEKTLIGREFLARAAGSGLRCNIDTSEENRIYGSAWIEFLRSCRTTLGTESGASVVDFDGSIERRVRQHLAAHPGASFAEVEATILAPHEDRPRHATISPRVFEAASLRTALLLFPGPYSGIVRPWEHYIPLSPDFSNFDEVAHLLRDERYLAELTERAWRELVASGRYSYREAIREFDAAIEGRLGPPRGAHKLAYGVALLETSEPVRAVKGFAALGRRVAMEASLALRAARSDVGRRPAFRRIIEHRLRAGGGAPPWTRFLADLLRLAYLADAAGERAPRGFGLAAAFDPGTGKLVIRSVPGEEHVAGPVAGFSVHSAIASSIREMTWDHSAVGATLSLGEHVPPLPLGDDGVYPFTSIPWLAATAPDLLGPLLAFVSDRAGASGT